MKDPDDHETIDELFLELREAIIAGSPHNYSFFKNYLIDEVTDKVRGAINTVFDGLIAITMFLCFFSLSASMSSNLFEQKKEIGVLRAIGFTKYRVRILFFYESLVLVLTSCTLGLLIGLVVGYTMVLQFNLFFH